MNCEVESESSFERRVFPESWDWVAALVRTKALRSWAMRLRANSLLFLRRTGQYGVHFQAPALALYRALEPKAAGLLTLSMSNTILAQGVHVAWAPSWDEPHAGNSVRLAVCPHRAAD